MEWKAPLIILVVEDDENDSTLLEHAFRKVGMGMPIYVCRDGEEAMAYLKAEKQFSDRIKYPFPRVVITDLKMPRCSGFELLQWLQDHPECNLIPKIVLSASAQPSDVKKAYQLGANCYFKKPATFDELLQLVRSAQQFWFAAELPDLPKNC